MRTSYNAFFFVTLKPWDERKTRAEQFQAIKAQPEPEAQPAAGGHRVQLLAAGDSRRRHFRRIHVHPGGSRRQRRAVSVATILHTFIDAARKRPEIAGLSTTFLPSVPQQFVEVDRDKVLKQGVPLNDVYRTIQAFMGGYFINYFNRFGRQWQVYIEAEGEYRARAENVGQFYVRNNKGEDVPLSALTSFEPRIGPGIYHALQRVSLRRNQRQRGAGLQRGPGDGGAGRSFQTDHAARDGLRLHGHVVPGEEGAARRSASVIFGFSLLFVFLILAALYESWSLPFSVLAEHAGGGVWSVWGAVAAPRAARRFSARLTWCRSKATSIRRSVW